MGVRDGVQPLGIRYGRNYFGWSGGAIRTVASSDPVFGGYIGTTKSICGARNLPASDDPLQHGIRYIDVRFGKGLL